MVTLVLSIIICLLIIALVYKFYVNNENNKKIMALEEEVKSVNAAHLRLKTESAGKTCPTCPAQTPCPTCPPQLPCPEFSPNWVPQLIEGLHIHDRGVAGIYKIENGKKRVYLTPQSYASHGNPKAIIVSAELTNAIPDGPPMPMFV